MAVMYVDIRNTPPPAEWGVTISSRAIEDLADQWRERAFPLPAWNYKGLPRGLDDGDWYNLCVVACSVLACIWPPEEEQMWTTHFEGEDLDDAPAVFSCFSRRIKSKSFDLNMFDGLTAAEFFAGDGVLQLREEKWQQLNDVVAAIDTKWSGAVSNLVAAADHDAEKVVDLLAATIPGFRDAPDSPVGTLPFFKLARLATAMMSSGGSTPFRNLDCLRGSAGRSHRCAPRYREGVVLGAGYPLGNGVLRRPPCRGAPEKGRRSVHPGPRLCAVGKRRARTRCGQHG